MDMTADSPDLDPQRTPQGPAMHDGGRINQSMTSSFQKGEMAEIDRGRARDGDVGAEEAARVAGSEAVEADSDRRKIEAEVAQLEAKDPASDATKDARDALAQAETLADDAISASLDSDQYAEDAHRNSRFLHHDAASVAEDGKRAEEDVGRASHDLATLDQLETRVETDGNGPATNSPTGVPDNGGAA
jgi:hypothetical protein